MRFIRNLAAVMAVLVLAACANLATTSPNAQIELAAKTVEAYVDMTVTSLQRGRITPEQAAKASENAKKARDTIVAARVALAGCKPETPCTGFTSLLQGLQPSLYEFERELRAQQGAK